MRRLTQMIILCHDVANQLIRILRILIVTTHKIATKTIRHEEISSQRSAVRYQRSVIGINHLPKHCVVAGQIGGPVVARRSRWASV